MNIKQLQEKLSEAKDIEGEAKICFVLPDRTVLVHVKNIVFDYDNKIVVYHESIKQYNESY